MMPLRIPLATAPACDWTFSFLYVFATWNLIVWGERFISSEISLMAFPSARSSRTSISLSVRSCSSEVLLFFALLALLAAENAPRTMDATWGSSEAPPDMTSSIPWMISSMLVFLSR